MKYLQLTDRTKGISRGFLNIDALPGGLAEFFEEYDGRKAGGLIGLISYLTQSPLDDVTMYVMMELRSMCQKWPDSDLELKEEDDDRDEVGSE